MKLIKKKKKKKKKRTTIYDTLNSHNAVRGRPLGDVRQSGTVKLSKLRG